MRRQHHRAVAATGGMDAAIGLVNGVLLSVPLWAAFLWLAAAF